MNLNNLIQYAKATKTDDPLIGISVPPPINAQAVRSAIITRCGLLTPIYNDPNTFRQTVTDWFFEKQWTFEHLINVIKVEYNPIENYDRYETEKTTDDRKRQETRSGSDTHSGTDKENRDITNTISAENSSSYQPDNKSEMDSDTTYGHRIARQDSSNGIENGSGTRESHLHGNIGVTTNQQMIEQELELLRHFDIYGFIAEEFEKAHMLMIY